jgi:FRG domain
MQIIEVPTWEKFEEQLQTRITPTSGQCLFRGQGNSDWPLDTTLERNGERHMPFADYYRLTLVVRPQIETFTGTKWGTLPEFPEVKRLAQEYDEFSLMLDGIGRTFPAYSYMAYLRHHGFPSPLLDWTRTPYVAAYFAFRNAAKERVAIYVYWERPENIKGWSSTETQIHTLGPYVRTHRRHFLQQSTYTICLDFQINRGWNFAPHESVFARNNPRQDVLFKFTIPVTERLKVLKILDSYNLNAFSLFDSEEALMETMAFRHMDFKR